MRADSKPDRPFSQLNIRISAPAVIASMARFSGSIQLLGRRIGAIPGTCPMLPPIEAGKSDRQRRQNKQGIVTLTSRGRRVGECRRTVAIYAAFWTQVSSCQTLKASDRISR
jgi:hypothetical protein